MLEKDGSEVSLTRQHGFRRRCTNLSLLLPVTQELLQVPLAVLLLQPTEAQRWGLQNPEQGQGASLIQSQAYVS